MVNLKDGGEIIILGKSHSIEYSSHRSIKPLIHIFEDKVRVYQGVSSKSHKDVLTSELRKKAKRYLFRRTIELSEKFSIEINKIAIRNQSTRWGSCSSSRNINLNWKLFLLPINVSDYVILHELAHTIEMNHSKAFWNEVEKMDPKWKSNRTSLRNIEKFLAKI